MSMPCTAIKPSGRLTLTGYRYPDAQMMAIWIDDGKVSGDEPFQVLTTDPEVQRWVAPGFCDLQVNGFAGRDFMAPDLDVGDIECMAQAILCTGVTRFLPTVVTAELDLMCRQLAVIADAIEQVPLVSAMCPGIHLVGPFIRSEDGPRGKHPRSCVREAEIADFEQLWRAARGRLALLTMAPDVHGAIALIRHAVNQGVVVSLGHHRAGRDVLDAAIAAGARLCAHPGIGCDPVLPRHDNYIWDQLADDRLWASFIADGRHLPAATLKSMLRAKTCLRSVLVTDATSTAGLPQTVNSATDMPTTIAKAVIDGGATLLEALAMASVRPAMLLPGWQGPWSCFAGRPADMVEFDWYRQEGRLVVRKVVYAGFAASPSPSAATR